MRFWRYALRELARRRGRSMLSLLSVVIAVAAIVAVASATATTRRAYRQVFEALAGRADLEIVSRGGGRFRQRAAYKLKSLDQVRAVVPVLRCATIVYAGGSRAKVLAMGVSPDDSEAIAGFHVDRGRMPAAAGEMAIEAGLASSLKVAVGDEVRLLTSRGLRRQKITGIIALQSAVRLHQGGMLFLPMQSLQRLYAAPGQVDTMHVFLRDPGRAAETIDRAQPLLPDELRIKIPGSRSGLAEETLLLTEVSLNMAGGLSFTTAVCIALSVFLMNVGERRRQLSILRAIGATRGQVVGIVCREALVLGLLGTAIGIPLGMYGGSLLMRTMAAALQIPLPASPDLGWALLAGGIVGPAVCIVAAWYPARKASQISPLEGMRPAIADKAIRRVRGTTVAGLLGTVVSVGLAVGSVRGDVPIWSAVVCVILSLVSLVLLLPLVLSPLVRLLSRPIQSLLAVEGEISERLVLRHPGRSALTVGVLFIAVAAGVGTGNAVVSITEDIRTWYEQTITGDFLLRAMMPDLSGQSSTNMPESLRDELLSTPGVDRVDAVRFLRAEAAGREAIVVARDFDVYDRAPMAVINGDGAEVLRGLKRGEAVVGSVLAERARLQAGNIVEVVAGDRKCNLRIAGVVTEYTFGGSVVYVDRHHAAELFDIEGVDSFLIRSAPGQSKELESRLTALAHEKGLLLQSFAEVLRLIDAMVAGVTGGLWVLLALGLLVGALGVVNTLTVNVLEQTRELGMLQAIGMRRGQIVKTVLGQAAVIGLIGVVLGGLSGVFLARMINLCLGSLFGHYVAFSLDAGRVGLLLMAALSVVMLAALVPARRAAALNPIEAMRQE